ncbi:hypothetical protein Cgig2_021516 [Carnegiea gigantea]|uniref:Beta-carotene isomerase D27-like C-terminal domain-containing protein n=1 Tax=Carnegiea gigantea TaxID=171969 RepID=A0A9Q1QHL7_9CARY|nr:hypothetical protein Cgig2_021516 [Carnegiea gigantea]
MEGSVLHCKISSFIFFSPYRKRIYKTKTLPFRPLFCMSSTKTEPQKTVYRDTWFDVLAINHFSHNLQAASGYAGITTQKTGYEGLLETCKEVTNKFNPMEQRRVVFESLERAIPMQLFPLAIMIRKLTQLVFLDQLIEQTIAKNDPSSPKPYLNGILFKALLPQTRFVRQFFAAFTALFCAWLVGPIEKLRGQSNKFADGQLMKVKESEVKGRREKNVAYIKKCRFLESSNCVGMCTNLCKFPTQKFIKDSLGMPVTMVPSM